jgi:hypothetical protein
MLALGAYLAVLLALDGAHSALGGSVSAFLVRLVTPFLACVVGLVVYVRLGRPDPPPGGASRAPDAVVAGGDPGRVDAGCPVP